MKNCTVCGALKDEAEFYLTSKGRPASRCKDCTRAAVRDNYIRNREHYRSYERSRAKLPHRIKAREEYARTEQGRIHGGASKKRYIARNAIKRHAHSLVNSAIRCGRLDRKPCEMCGNIDAQAHHDDYSKPLDVRWLCTTHHAEWHRHNTPLCPDQENAA